jgi:hypothetical protein
MEAQSALPSIACGKGIDFEPLSLGKTLRLNERRWFWDEPLLVANRVVADLIVSISRAVTTMRRCCYFRNQMAIAARTFARCGSATLVRCAAFGASALLMM